MARLRRFFAEAPIFFIAVVVGIALMFRVAIGWAKAPAAQEDPTLPAAQTSQPAAGSPSTKTVTPVVTAEPRPAATATVPSTPRKKPRPRH